MIRKPPTRQKRPAIKNRFVNPEPTFWFTIYSNIERWPQRKHIENTRPGSDPSRTSVRPLHGSGLPLSATHHLYLLRSDPSTDLLFHFRLYFALTIPDIFAAINTNWLLHGALDLLGKWFFIALRHGSGFIAIIFQAVQGIILRRGFSARVTLFIIRVSFEDGPRGWRMPSC